MPIVGERPIYDSRSDDAVKGMPFNRCDERLCEYFVFRAVFWLLRRVVHETTMISQRSPVERFCSLPCYGAAIVVARAARLWR